MQRYFIKRSLMSLFAVRPRTGVPLFTNDHNSKTRPKASWKTASPFLPNLLWKTKNKFFLINLGSEVCPVVF